MLIRRKANGVCVIQDDPSINLLGVLKIIGCFVVIIYAKPFFVSCGTYIVFFCLSRDILVSCRGYVPAIVIYLPLAPSDQRVAFQYILVEVGDLLVAFHDDLANDGNLHVKVGDLRVTLPYDFAYDGNFHVEISDLRITLGQNI